MRVAIRNGCMAVLVMVAAPAFAEGVTVTDTLVKSGYYLAPDCAPEADPKAFNECICQADIKKAQVRGLAPDVATLINERLSLLPEKLAAESCEGKPSEPPAAGLKVNTASAGYSIALQTEKLLTVLITYATYGAGAEHPLEGTEGFTFDLTTGRALDPIAALKPEEITKADAFIKAELIKKYPSLYEEAKTRPEPYLTEFGCDTCTIFYGAEGWTVRFQLDAVAPYMTGEPEIALPTSVIPSPAELSLRH